MAQVGSEWPKWGQDGPSAFDTYLIYLFDAQAVRNGYSIFDSPSNRCHVADEHVTLQTNMSCCRRTSNAIST